MNHIFAMVVMILTENVMNVDDVAIVFIKGSDKFWHISKDDVINKIKNYNLNLKNRLL